MIEVMKQALEALEGYESCIDAYYAGAVCPQIDKAITAIKEVLAQPEQEPNVDCNAHPEFLRGYAAAAEYFPPQPKEPEQEPVAVVTGVYGGRFIVEPTNSAMLLPVNMALYTTPPQRTWVELTDEEIQECLKGLPTQTIDVYARRIEAKLKEKNGL